MELSKYLSVVRRWWLLLLAPAVIVAGIGLATYTRPTARYVATVHLSASLPPSEEAAGGSAGTYFDPAYFSWLTSEYIVAGLADWAETGAFAGAVSNELDSGEVQLTPAAVRASISSDYERSELVLYFSAAAPEHVWAIAEAATAVMQQQNVAVFPQLGGRNATVVPLDEPAVALAPPGLGSRIELLLRVVTGLAVGLLLVYAAHYFDPFLRSRVEVERLGLRVIGEIPSQRG